MVIQTLQRLMLASVMVAGVWFMVFSPVPTSQPQTTMQLSAEVQQYPPPDDRPPLDATKEPEPEPTTPPPVVPTEAPPQQPTTAPGDTAIPAPLARPPSSGRQSSRPYVTPMPQARITGTVIDESTGLPVSNLAVRVGDTMVQTDAFGNYERNKLAAGNYCVELVLEEGQGMRLQYPMIVTVVGDTTVIRHLYFSSSPSLDMTPVLSDCMELDSPVQQRVPPAKKDSIPTPTPADHAVDEGATPTPVTPNEVPTPVEPEWGN